MYTLFVVLIVIAALLMIGIVLIQESKGGGLASQFSGYNQIGGVRKTTDFIEKTTWGLAAWRALRLCSSSGFRFRFCYGEHRGTCYQSKQPAWFRCKSAEGCRSSCS